MTAEFNQLLSSFKKANQNKSDGKFGESDVNDIAQAARSFFQNDRDLSQSELEQIRDQWVALAEGRIDKGRAMKKLQGSSRAEAIEAVLRSLL